MSNMEAWFLINGSDIWYQWGWEVHSWCPINHQCIVDRQQKLNVFLEDLMSDGTCVDGAVAQDTTQVCGFKINFAGRAIISF